MSTVKRILSYIGIVLLCILLVLGMLVCVARSARVQTAVAGALAEQLSRALDARVEIGTLDYKFPNRLLVAHVLVEDQRQDTMLFVDTLSAKADLWRFFTEDTLTIRRIELSGGFADIHYLPADSALAGDSGSVLNCQFLIDAFASREKKERQPLGINLQIDDIALRELYANYCDWSAYLPSSSIHLRDISPGHLDAEIERLTFYAERNGLDIDIDRLEARLLVTDSLISFPKFKVEMPRSDIHIEEFSIRRSEINRLLAASTGGHSALADNPDAAGSNQQGTQSKISLHVHEATVTPADFAAVVPALRGLRQPLTLTACVDGHIDSLVASDLRIAYSGTPLLAGNVTALRLSQLDSLYVRAQVENLSINKHTLQDILSGASGQPVYLPDMLARLGQMHYRGALEGRLEDLSLRGAFTSALGSIRTDGHAYIALPKKENQDSAAISSEVGNAQQQATLTFCGVVSSRRFDLGRLLDVPDMGTIALTLHADGTLADGKPFAGRIRGNIEAFTFRDYTYRDIAVDGHLHDRRFRGDISSTDPNIRFDFTGEVDLNRSAPLSDFTLRLAHLRPGPLHLSEKYADADLSLSAQVDLVGAKLDDIVGAVRIDSLRLTRERGSFFIPEVLISAQNDNVIDNQSSKLLTITSSYLNASVWGDFSYATLPTSILRCVAKYVPRAFSTDRERELRNARPTNLLEFYLYANRLNEICDVLELPVSPSEMATVKGSLSDASGNINLQAYVPAMTAAGKQLESLTLAIDNATDDQLNLSLIGLLHPGESHAGRHLGDLNYYVSASARRDSILLGLSWANSAARQKEQANASGATQAAGTALTDAINSGNIRLTTTLSRYSNQPLITAHFHPSHFVLADSTWTLADSRFIWSAADTALQVDEFLLYSAHQSIYANGVISRSVSDSIYAELDNINLDYLLGALTNVHSAIWFGGTVTGWATGYGLLSTPMFEANVQMLDGQINGNLLGDVYATATFDREERHVLIQGDVIDPRLPAAPSRLDTIAPRRVFSSKPYPGYTPAPAVQSSALIRSKGITKSDSTTVSADNHLSIPQGDNAVNQLIASGVRHPESSQPDASSAVMDFAKAVRPGRHTVHLDGEVCNTDARWGLKIYPDSVDISFVSYWVGSFLSELQGRASGEVFVRGAKRAPAADGSYTTVTLACLPHNASFVLPFTGARYFVSDSIRLDSAAIVFNDMTLHDVEGNPVEFRGAVRHDGSFSNMDIDLTATPRRAIVLDLPEGSGEFYGRVFANGVATVRGSDKEITVTADATSAPRSTFTLSLAGASSAHSNEFIEFVDHTPSSIVTKKASDSKYHAYLDLRMSVTPDAEVSVLLDARTGDRLRGRGEGDIRFRYADVENQMQMLGTYVLQSGTFGFTFQNVIRREFQIAEGSSVTWTGNPEDPTVDVRALYHTTASLRDLYGSDYSSRSLTNRSNLPVNCVLNLSDRLVNPTLRFGIEFPQSDESVASQVQSVINTEEMLMRQVLYLLVFNRFYTPDYLQADGAYLGVNETYSLISSTVTGQINSWLSKLTDKFSVGFNMRTDGEGANSSQEYEAQFEFNPVRGLLINGNLGYRYNDISNQPVFGNLDIEYMLTPNGKLRAKAYTHTVDKYSLRQASTIQGVGFIFKHDFNWADVKKDSLQREAKREARTERKAQKQALKQALKK